MSKPLSFGPDDLMAVAAVRYCLGRRTYIVSDCADWLTEQWENIEPRAQAIIKQDVEESFMRDDKNRANGSDYKALGANCDREQWERVRTLWEGK